MTFWFGKEHLGVTSLTDLMKGHGAQVPRARVRRFVAPFFSREPKRTPLQHPSFVTSEVRGRHCWKSRVD